MSVLCIISKTSNLEDIISFSIHTANALNQNCRILEISSGVENKKQLNWRNLDKLNSKEKLLSNDKIFEYITKNLPFNYSLDKISYEIFTDSDINRIVINDIKNNKYSYVIVLDDHINLDNNISNNIYTQVFHKSPSAVIMYRPTKSYFTSSSKILLPTSGGPNANKALILAARLLKYKEINLTTLYIEPEIEDYGKEVGGHLLEKILKKNKLLNHNQINPVVALNDNVFNGIKNEIEKKPYDLLLIGATNAGFVKRMIFNNIPKQLLESNGGLSIGVIRKEKGGINKLKDNIETLFDILVPQLNREDKINLFENLQVGSEWNFDFLVLMLLSTIIASIGLIQDSAAVVIGAMLIAPLITPLLGAGLSLVQGNFPLIKSSAKSIFYGFFISLITAFTVGFLSPIANLTPEIIARGRPSLLDVFVAFFSGVAAAHCSARSNLSAALPGVAIAAALVPPLASIGISASLGELDVMFGATLLFLTNIVSIILGALLTFYSAGIRIKSNISSAVVWAKRTTIALVLSLAIISIPLSSVLLSNFSEINFSKNQDLRDAIIDLKNQLKFRNIEIELDEYKKSKTGGVIYINVKAPTLLDNKTIDKIYKSIINKSPNDTKIEIRTEIVRIFD